MENEEKLTVKEFFMKTLNGTAFGLFATLIVGTIFSAIATLFNFGSETSEFCKAMYMFLRVSDPIDPKIKGLAGILQALTGAGIGVGIALSLKFDPLKTIILAGVGEIAAAFSLPMAFVTNPSGVNHFVASFQAGDPLTIYLVCISAALLIKLVFRKKTPVDFILIPLFGASVGLLLALGIRYPAITVTWAIQWLIGVSTEAVPFVMGVVVAVLMGMALTAPISSAAIAAAIFKIEGADPSIVNGLIMASGAAIVGCSTQMIGFAIQSRKDNPIGMVISVGIGTSMFQFKNIIKKPIIWLPTIITSAILGPISTCWLILRCDGANAGMGTAGLVGQIGTVMSMGVNSWQAWVGVFVLQIVLPAILVFLIDLLFRKLNLIKEGDLKI